MRSARVLAVAAPVLLLLAGSGAAGAALSARTPDGAGACVPNVAEVISAPASAESALAALPGELVSILDSAAHVSFETTGAPGAIVGVRTPKGTWTAAYGFADQVTGQPMTTDMHTRIGSVTKAFTGTMILQLAEEGKLSLNDTIDRYYAGIPNGQSITLRHLATMTSGIASYYTDEFLRRYFGAPNTIFTPDELIAYGVAASPVLEPGEMFYYSNTNTILLGKVIEAVTGQPVREVLRQRIIEPLGLTGTSLPDSSPEIPLPHPQGYTIQGTGLPGTIRNATGWSPSFGWTASGMISNLEDLLTYGRALGTGQGLLSPQTQAQRLSFTRPAGYGLAIGCSGGWVGHTGELPGFNTSVHYDTTTATSVVVMVNSDIASAGCTPSPAFTDTPADVACSSPAMRMFVAVSEALGHVFQPPFAN